MNVSFTLNADLTLKLVIPGFFSLFNVLIVVVLLSYKTSRERGTWDVGRVAGSARCHRSKFLAGSLKSTALDILYEKLVESSHLMSGYLLKAD